MAFFSPSSTSFRLKLNFVGLGDLVPVLLLEDRALLEATRLLYRQARVLGGSFLRQAQTSALHVDLAPPF
jgi:hypothetical protein